MTTAEELPARLQAVLADTLTLDVSDVTVQNLRPLKRGFRRATWAFDAITPHGRGSLILTMELVQRNPLYPSPELQARAQIVARAGGVPVPRVVAADDSPEKLGGPFVITEMVRGETEHADIVRRLDSGGRHAGGRAQLLRQCASVLSRIHRIETTDPEKARQDRLKLFRPSLDAFDDVPATFEWAYRWLVAHQPSPSPAVVVHGDYRIGNLIVDGLRMTAVIDWEWMHVGEATEDLAWFCDRAWRFGAPASMAAGGLGSIESFLSAYEEASETKVDRVAFAWWRVMVSLLRGITSCSEAAGGLANRNPAMKTAIAGRRLCEIEWDLLNLIEEADS